VGFKSFNPVGCIAWHLWVVLCTLFCIVLEVIKMKQQDQDLKGYRIESKRLDSEATFVSYGPGLSEEHAVLIYQNENPDAVQIEATLTSKSWASLLHDLQFG
jgi:hypothetical protein